MAEDTPKSVIAARVLQHFEDQFGHWERLGAAAARARGDAQNLIMSSEWSQARQDERNAAAEEALTKLRVFERTMLRYAFIIVKKRPPRSMPR